VRLGTRRSEPSNPRLIADAAGNTPVAFSTWRNVRLLLAWHRTFLAKRPLMIASRPIAPAIQIRQPTILFYALLSGAVYLARRNTSERLDSS